MTKQRTINQSIGILLRSYTRAIQKQQNLSGSLFQKHTKSKALIDEIEIEPSYWDSAFGTIINIPEGKNYLETCIEYVHQNPVYSGLVNNADEWEFSSFRDYIGLRKGKLIDYDLLRKENIIFHAQEKSHTLTQSEGMTTNTSIISIGSNIDAEINISKMLEILGNEVEIIKVSSMLKTKPIGIENQPDFTNGVVKISTSRSKKDLKSLLKAIENQLGRNRKGPKFGPRTMDLDIVVWNGKIVDEDYYTRDFLRQSIDEIGGY
ncbi:2-amino-4-hydroxy-6-hydroxymethyldihydropteridine diphosphokinase [Tangfeifania diversioriginum]|nr:2-amino-4-hydroxy-6-hydroxymethyldihydropteridine diphosphokinase [Tangfeifania diversioriginum]